MRRTTLPLLAALLLAACGHGGDAGGDAVPASPAPEGHRIDVAGSPYALTVPAGLTSVDLPPYDPAPAGGRGEFAIRVGRSADGATATLMAIPAGETLTDAPLELARRFALATAQTGDPGRAARGPLQQRTLGGRVGFRIPANGSQTDEYRGAAVGSWLVLELCSTTIPGQDPGALCDALDATLELHDAPPAAPAAGGDIVAPAGGLYRFTVPSGFSPASAARQSRLTRDLQVGQATLVRRSWENTIIVLASTTTPDYRPPASSAAFCALLEPQFPVVAHRLSPAKGTIGGSKAVACTVRARPGRDAAMMPDQRGHLLLATVGDTVVEVLCSSTDAQGKATEAACDQVLEAVETG